MKKNTITKEQLFAEKAKTYVCCFNAQCPQREQCLRWEVGQYAASADRVATCVSPVYEHAADGHCDLFASNLPVTMPVGMKQHFYRQMPGLTERAIKRDLIDATCRATYYKYHSGHRPITPAVQQLIEDTCRRHGWKGPFRYDGETTDYVW